DGDLDLIASSFDETLPGAGHLIVLLGNGDGTFQAADETALPSGSYHLASGDFDLDGREDVVLSIYWTAPQLLVYPGNGDGTFDTPQSITDGDFDAPMGVYVNDLNNDGFADIVMKDSGDNQFFVLLGDGDGTFEASATYSGAGYMLEGGDVNNNGSLDLMIADFQNDQALLSLNNGLGVYSGPSDFAVGTQPRDVHLADFNHDGAIDFLTSNFGSQNLTLYLNQSDTQGPTCTITYDGGNGAGADFTLNVEGNNVIPLTGTATDVDTEGSEVTLVGVSINAGVDWENAVDTGGGTPWSTWSYLATLVDGQNQ